MIEQAKEVAKRLRSHHVPVVWAADTIDALRAALEAADREREQLLTEYRESVDSAVARENQIVLLKAENAKLRLDAERYRAIRKATLTEDDAFVDALDDAGTPKTDAQFDSAFDAAIDAARKALGEQT